MAKVFQFKITLKDTKPAIWRRIQISEACSFWNLHEAIQCAMGWENSHLHSFDVINESGEREDIGLEDKEFGSKDGRKIKLRKYISLENNKMCYVYDFGDNWDHLVTLERVIDKQSNQNYPVCVNGARACPPEDVGGARGYEEFLEAIAKPSHPRHKELLEWMREVEFRPEHFDPKEVHFSELEYTQEDNY